MDALGNELLILAWGDEKNGGPEKWSIYERGSVALEQVVV